MALAAGGLLLLGALLVVLLAPANGQSGSNKLTPQAFVLVAEPGQEVCQPESVPDPTGSIRMTIGTYGRSTPPVVATLRVGRRVLARGVRRAGWREGVVELPLPVRRGVRARTRLCVRAAGPVRMALGGERVAPFARVGGRLVRARAAVVFLLPGERSWAASAGDIAGRFGYGRADLLGGHWALWAAAGLMLLTAGLGVRAVTR